MTAMNLDFAVSRIKVKLGHKRWAGLCFTFNSRIKVRGHSRKLFPDPYLILLAGKCSVAVTNGPPLNLPVNEWALRREFLRKSRSQKTVSERIRNLVLVWLG
ncbi:hypothetical protein CEXT_353811 [Caerostris extrusa]|uniref:Uncharacterized protein n=1 Tax=Caerostris extrusa TaxID=172846 RepID=A0AAV4X3C0_CAEEX|nr:hypothetical protein CEXT_353811 [Caerostris extrusa]